MSAYLICKGDIFGALLKWPSDFFYRDNGHRIIMIVFKVYRTKYNYVISIGFQLAEKLIKQSCLLSVLEFSVADIERIDTWVVRQ